MPGFPDPPGTAASEAHAQPLGTPLQSPPRSHEPGTRYPGPALSFAAPNGASTPASAGVKGGVKLDHRGGRKIDQFTGGWGFALRDLRGRLERRPAAPV